MSNQWSPSTTTAQPVVLTSQSNGLSLPSDQIQAIAVASVLPHIDVTAQIPQRARNAFKGLRVVFVDGEPRLMNDPRQWVPMPTIQAKYWVNMATGSDSAAGTEAAPFKSIWKAQQAANAGNVPTLVNVMAGKADRFTGFYKSAAPGSTDDIASVPIVYRAVGGEVIYYSGSTLTWTLDGGTTYKTTRSSVARVIDWSTTTAKGDYLDFPKAVSEAACKATPGTYYTDNVSVWVNRGGVQVVSDANTACLLNSVGTLEMTTSGNMWLLGNWRFLGGSAGNIRLQNNPTGKVYIENTVFQGVANTSGIVDSLTALNVATVVLNKCRFVGSSKDGANFHIQNGVIADALLLFCEGYENGTNTTSTSNNDVTTHDGGLLVEIGGKFTKSYGGSCGHADTNTLAVHIGTDAYESYGDLGRSGGVAQAGVGFHAINNAQIVKIGCKRGKEQLTTNGTIQNIEVF